MGESAAAIGRFLTFVIPGLTRDPPFPQESRPRIKAGVTMMEWAAPGRFQSLGSLGS
jgi:hypothetical protein